MISTESASTMKAAVYHRFGGPDVVAVEQTAKPAPKRNEVLIKVHASTVSAADYRARSRDIPKGLAILATVGVGAFRPSHRILGMDVAGVVESVGADVTDFKPGDEVIAMLGGKFGGHAEYARIAQDGAIALKPRTMSFEDAVTLVFGGITALGFLRRAAIKPGHTVLVNGASGAVGTAAVQLAKHFGAHVTAVTSSGNADLVTSLGADRVIDYTEVDFTTQPATYDVIVEAVGNAPFERVESLIKLGGALLLVVSDFTGIFNASRNSKRSGKLVSAGNVPYTAEPLEYLVNLAETERYEAVIDRTFDLADVAEAHRFVDAGRKRGNVVLRLASSKILAQSTHNPTTEGRNS
jgi:NADPH:quinone reductase-like Zn-dependent oxidoreductase